MSKIALFIRHHALPGRRDDVQRVWEKYVKPNAAANPDHEAYYFCRDMIDPDVISVFQLYSDEDGPQAFMTSPWYPQYLEEVSEFVVAPPVISPASLVWAKSDSPQQT